MSSPFIPSFLASVRSRRLWLVCWALLVTPAGAQTPPRLLVHQSFQTPMLTLSEGVVIAAEGVGGPLENTLGNAEQPTFYADDERAGAVDFSAGRLNQNEFAGGSTSVGDHFTIAFWMRTADVRQVSQSYILQVGGAQSPQNAVLFGYVAGLVELYVNQVTGDDPRPISGIPLPPELNNHWIHIAYTYDGVSLKGYRNGERLFSRPARLNLTATGGLSIGGSRNGNLANAAFFPGQLDDVMIWRGALTAQQVEMLRPNALAQFPATLQLGGRTVPGQPSAPLVPPLAQPLVLGNALIGGQVTSKLTVENGGAGELFVQLTSSSPELWISPLGFNLYAGESFQVDLTFVPTGLGTRSGTITVTSNGASGPVVLPFFGNTVGSNPTAQLASLQVGFPQHGAPANLAPAFAPGSPLYSLTAPNDETELSLIATAAQGATIRVNGNVVSGGGLNLLPLAVGLNSVAINVSAGGQNWSYLLNVTRLSALEAWRQAWYGQTSNSGAAADNASPYGTGISNLAVFAFLGPGQNPATARASQLPQLVRGAPNYLVCSFQRPAGVEGIVYGAELSDLGTEDWFPLTAGNPDGTFFGYALNGERKLGFRLRVSR